MAERIQGVGVLRYPNLAGARESAQHLAERIYPGCIVCLSNDKDHLGNFLWDFRIEQGDPGQVKIERSDACDTPIVVAQKPPSW